MDTFLQIAWSAIKAIFVTLGGFAGMTKILEWLFKGPKLTGQIERIIAGSEITPEGSYVGAHVMMQLYLVNRRIAPVAVKSFGVSARIGGTWRDARLVAIPNGFRLRDIPNFDFSQSRLYELVMFDVLEYGKGVRGWLRMTFQGQAVEQVQLADWRIEIQDAFGKKHWIKQKYQEPTPGDFYFPGTGQA